MSEPTVREYRCKHIVEAARWIDTDENRATFSDWFDAHGVLFSTRGPVIVLPDECGEAQEGEWVMFSSGEFLVMSDEAFRESYVEESRQAMSEAAAHHDPGDEDRRPIFVGPWCKNCGDAYDGPERPCPRPAPGEPYKDCGRGGHMFRLDREPVATASDGVL